MFPLLLLHSTVLSLILFLLLLARSRPFSWPGCEPRPAPVHHVGSSQMLLLPVQAQELPVCSRRHCLFLSFHFQTQCHSGCLPCSDLHTSDLGWWMPTFHWHWTGLQNTMWGAGGVIGWEYLWGSLWIKVWYRDGDYRIRHPFCLLPAILKNLYPPNISPSYGKWLKAKENIQVSIYMGFSFPKWKICYMWKIKQILWYVSITQHVN